MAPETYRGIILKNFANCRYVTRDISNFSFVLSDQLQAKLEAGKNELSKAAFKSCIVIEITVNWRLWVKIDRYSMSMLMGLWSMSLTFPST